ncbi:MAG: hypothetical protein ACRC2T_09230 [Thermoguttaceae bacterium]
MKVTKREYFAPLRVGIARAKYCLIIMIAFLMVTMQTGFIFAAKKEEEKPPEWVLSFALVGFCIALGLIFVIRSSKRANSVISEYDRKRMQEEELKKAGKH